MLGCTQFIEDYRFGSFVLLSICTLLGCDTESHTGDSKNSRAQIVSKENVSGANGKPAQDPPEFRSDLQDKGSRNNALKNFMIFEDEISHLPRRCQQTTEERWILPCLVCDLTESYILKKRRQKCSSFVEKTKSRFTTTPKWEGTTHILVVSEKIERCSEMLTRGPDPEIAQGLRYKTKVRGYNCSEKE
jgi:hypothetical protein